MPKESRIACGTTLVDLEVFLEALETSIRDARIATRWGPGLRKLPVSWAYQPAAGPWMFLPEHEASDALVLALAARLGVPLRVVDAVCEEDDESASIGFEATEIRGKSKAVPIELDVEPEDVDDATSGPPAERVGQVLRILAGFDDKLGDVSHELTLFVPIADGEEPNIASVDSREDLGELLEQSDTARRVVVARIAEDLYQITFIDVLVKLGANRPALPLARSRSRLNGADTDLLLAHVRQRSASKLAEPSVRPLDLEEQLFDVEEEAFGFEDDDDLDEAGDAFALDLLTGSSQLKSLLKEFLPEAEELVREPQPVALEPAVTVHPDAIVSSREEARKLLDILLKGDELELDDPASVEDLVEGVFQIGSQGGDAESVAGELADWLLDQPCVEELYIDDEKLTDLLRVW